MNRNSPRLDRLSVLLDGLSASVAILHAGPLVHPLTPAGDPRSHLYLHLLLSGEAKCRLPGGERRLASPSAMVLHSDLAHTVVAAAGTPELLSARIRFDGPSGGAFHAAFGDPVELPLNGATDDATHLLALIGSELRSPRCGHRNLLTHAVDMLLISLLRHIIARPGSGAGLLAALADPRIARAVVAMNENVAQRWNLESLAATAGMSRTAFAAAFRERMGATPGRYLAGLRLAVAEQAVVAGHGLKRAAQASGYASPAALSRALSRRRRRPPTPG
ncbi:AraC family transcriptional regulator [Azospira restricta]|uniref:Helix-turn-helix transcriptional regulator n=1 Tax=Azospira restricta TaxID=404405 RepID=A0A974SPS4_9RHOO|nr:AraC family transcriptional regulator [Azospira restricta]QRJ64164.1 helix-turn-helix transcriptional regulator [Azospira restricta]